MSDPSQLTRLLTDLTDGRAQADDALLSAVYKELRLLATQKLRREPAGQTLQATALVHEAWMRLQGDGVGWDGRGHFFAAAAEAMRRILVERARRRYRLKHGGASARVTLDEEPAIEAPQADLDLLALDEALQKLEEESPEKARLVKLRYFVGLPMTEVAEILGISRAKANRQWAYVRAYLFQEVRRGDTVSHNPPKS